MEIGKKDENSIDTKQKSAPVVNIMFRTFNSYEISWYLM